MNFMTPWFKNSWLRSPGLGSSWLKNLGLKNSWLKCLGLVSSWLKNLGLKGLGLKLGVEKSGVEMSFNHMTALCVYQFWENTLPCALISYCGIIRYSVVSRMIELVPQIFMPIQILDLHRVMGINKTADGRVKLKHDFTKTLSNLHCPGINA